MTAKEWAVTLGAEIDANGDSEAVVAAVFKRALDAERERCAQIAEAYTVGRFIGEHNDDCGDVIAGKIRGTT